MHIIFKRKLNTALVITVGYSNELGASVAFIDVIREYYDKQGNVEYAKMYCSFFKQRRFWKKGEWFLFKIF
jgi:hypothetical protein